MRIAVIDDDPIFQFISRKTIETISTDHQILRFNNGKEAFDFIELNLADVSTLPELVLLDLNMPIMDGWQFLDRLSSLVTPYQLPIYVVTSSSAAADLEEAESHPELQGYLVKPFTREQMMKVLDAVSNGCLGWSGMV